MNNLSQTDWEALLCQHIPRLRRYALALTRNKDTSDDLVQDCLERALSKMHLWKNDGNLRAWLFTIMHNIFVNGVRKNSAKFSDAPFDDFRSTIDDADNAVILRDFQRCLDQLNTETREILILAGLENLTYKEIAEITSLPIGTVMSRLSRGREQLRQLMNESAEPGFMGAK